MPLLAMAEAMKRHPEMALESQRRFTDYLRRTLRPEEPQPAMQSA